MAESQIAGLFMTPEMYRQQQMQADRMRAMEYARLAPEERAAIGFFSAGQGLGRATGTLLGAQDPQLQRITEQQQMLQGLDVSNPDSLMEAAGRASQAGNVPLAMQLAGRAQEINANAALIEQRIAAARASGREPAPPTTNEVTNARAFAASAGPEGSPEYNTAFLQELRRLTTKEGPNTVQQLLVSGKFTPDSVAAYQRSGNIADLKPINPATKTQVVETAKGLNLVDMGTGLTIANLGASPARSGGAGSGGTPFFQPVQTATGVFAFNARTGKVEPVTGPEGAPIVGAAADPTLQGSIAGARAGATVTARSVAEAAINAPRAIAQGEESIRLVDDLLKSPGLKQAVGTSRLAQLQRVPGTPARDFDIRLEQLKGQQFLQAYETLKGGGHITEVEGKKATDAISRMDASSSEKEFVNAAREFQTAIRAGVERAKKAQTGGQQTAPAAAGRGAGAPGTPGNPIRLD